MMYFGSVASFSNTSSAFSAIRRSSCGGGGWRAIVPKASSYMAWKVCSRSRTCDSWTSTTVAAGSQGAGRGSEAVTLLATGSRFGGLAGAAADRAAAGRSGPRISSHTHAATGDGRQDEEQSDDQALSHFCLILP